MAEILNCSNCGKNPTEVKKLIRAAEFCICDECVGLCVAILLRDGVPLPEYNLSDPVIVMHGEDNQ